MRTSALADQLSALLAGQPDAIETIVPFVQMHETGLSPEDRPIGVLLLLGPTGTGKTRTVEALAEVLHGSSKKLLKINCGDFVHDGDAAKLVGAPPGYLGHRETQPMLSQPKVNTAASDESDISILLFDEVEKSPARILNSLLSIMDKAQLQL